MKIYYGYLTSILVTAAMALPAQAQSGSQSGADSADRQRSESQSGSRDRSARDRNDQQAQQDQRDRRSQQSNRQRRSQQSDSRQSAQLRPSGWVAVAYDFDNDGFYEHADWIYYFDLQSAQERSQQRAHQGRQGARDRQAQSGDRGRREQVRIRGEVTNLGLKSMMLGSDQQSGSKHQFARVETESGNSVRVCLGKQDKVSQLDVQEGDRITVEGVRAKIDDKEVILARRVSTGNESITNQLPKRANWQRLSGQIRSVTQTQSGERNERHTVVKLKDQKGRVKQIDLGPARELQDLELQEGDKVTVLGRQGRIDDESIMIAQVVRANGQSIDVREATDRSLRNGSERQRR